MKHLYIYMSLILPLFFTHTAQALSVMKTSPEENVRRATLILEATVLDMRYEESSRGVPFAVIRLQVEDHIVGNSQDIIEIRRPFVTPDFQFLSLEVLPAFSVEERFIITLLQNNTERAQGVYSVLGLYDGKFAVTGNTIRNSGITVEEFKRQIRQVRANAIDRFPQELPRHDTASAARQRVAERQNSAMFSCADGQPYLDDEFRVWDFTWNTSFVPAEIHYNPAGAPPGTPSASTIATLANMTYALWDQTYSFFSFQNASPFTTTEGQVKNNTSVILWSNLGWPAALAYARPFPNTEDKIIDCDTDGPGSNRAVDIVFNSNPNINWHINTSPPLGHTTVAVDFVEVLAHELGHGLGLAHIPHNTNSIMHNWYDNRTGPVRGMTNGDRAAMVFQHTVPDISGLSGSFPFDIAISASTKNFSFTKH